MSDSTIELIIGGVEKIFTALKAAFAGIDFVNDEEHKAEIAFTQQFVGRARAQNPNKNVLIVHPKHTANFVNSASGFVELPLFHRGAFQGGPGGPSQGYNWYVFDSGTFKLEGDGGFENYCYAGNYQKNSDGTISFSLINQPSSPATSDGPGVSTSPPTPIRSHPDGVYLMNCRRGDEVSSGLAYYKNVKNGGNDGQQPDDYIDVSHGSFTTWESTGTGKFGNGTVFEWDILPHAQQGVNFACVGLANNSFERFLVYKDNGRVLYEVDGWQCSTIYWCF